MSPASLIRLFSLAAIWGSSFIFMRIGVPVLGPWWLIEIRVALAAVFLAIVGRLLHKRLDLKTHWRHFLVLSFFNSALPFLLFAYASQTLSASLSSVLNATAPIWGAVITAAWTRTALSLKTVFGLALGVVGVGILVGFDPSMLQADAMLAVAAALAASFSYGIATNYTKTAKAIEPFANAQGCMLVAALIILPTLGFVPMPSSVSPLVAISVLLLGTVCSGVAYLLYFRLINDMGATSALTVTFLIPIFGVAWGKIFLNETIGWHTIIGSIVVIFGTILVTGFSISRPRSAKSGVIPS